MKGYKSGAFAPKPHEAGDIILLATQPVELPGDAEWAQLHAASAADEYVKKLREKRKKHGK